MQKIWMTIGAATGAGLLAATPAAAVTVLDVNPDPASGCGKSNCFNAKGVFNQTWSAAEAKGPQTIGQFLMSRGVLGDLAGKTFRVAFSVGGKEIGSWGSYNMGGIGGDTLKFDGSDFLWNPEDGDLVLTLAMGTSAKGGFGGGGGFARAPSQDGPSSGAFGGSDPGGFTPPIVPMPPPGPSSQVEALALAVPEPAAWALMITGFGMAGATLRRRSPALARSRSKRLT